MRQLPTHTQALLKPEEQGRSPGIFGALSIAGEGLIRKFGQRWAIGASCATLTLSPLLALALHLNARYEVPQANIILGGVFGALSLVFTLSTVCLWPVLIKHALETLRQGAQVPAVAHRAFSLRRALIRSFGPSIALLTPLVLLSTAGLVYLAAAFDGFEATTLLIFVLLFSAASLLGLLATGGLSVAISGKQALDQRRSLSARRELQGPEALGALELAPEADEGSGALSLTQDAGLLTQASSTPPPSKTSNP